MKKFTPFVLLFVMLITGCGIGGINLTQPVTIASFDASPPSIAAGESSTLSWSVTGATSVSIDQGVGNVALTGSRVVTPAATTVYTLTAINAAGSGTTATTQVIVSGGTTPIPTPSPTPGSLPVINYFTASPSSIVAGASSTLTWNVSNATSITIDHGVGVVGASGTAPVLPTTTTNYTLTAINTTGSSNKSTVVFVFATSSFTVTGVTASANPSSFSGSCPATANFFATITASGPGTVNYRWERSDGTAGSTESVIFAGAGPQIVSTSWPLSTSGTYWERIHIYTPNEMTSNQASFTLNCMLLLPLTIDYWSGTWSTTYGMMHLTQSGNQVTGTYDYNSGHITGTVSGKVLTGTWSEAPTYSLPNHAGEFQFTISSDGKTFSGGWRFDSSGSWTSWTGTTIF
jgi:hypothetical protein